jgi:hypothetical protein
MFGIMFKRSAKPTPERRAVVNDLVKFGQELKQHRLNLSVHRDSAVRLLVEFFNSTSPRQDADIITRLSELKGDAAYRELLKEFNVHLRQTGRDRCGMNRSEYGHRVTWGDVYLGGVRGYYTHTVATIMSQGDDTEFYRAVNAQATSYLESHLGPMIRTIDALLQSTVVNEIIND